MKKFYVRFRRNRLLRATDWRMARAKEQVQLGIVPVDDRDKMALYRQYLRDFTKQSDWWLERPLGFKLWLEFCYHS
ncbi:MAG: phage tail assembly chaperone [Puniceicoccales bacterium]|nr:phage tail assembly chaperone [Puniceicoccales bacterium]